MRVSPHLLLILLALSTYGLGLVQATSYHPRFLPFPRETMRRREPAPKVAIGCDGILGSGLKLDKCGVCGGNNDQCEIKSGLFTSNSMGHGYHTIATIPTGAMHINVTELRKSRNYLALEGTNGNKYINMDWKIDASGNYSIAGTYFIYKKSPGRSQGGEQLLAIGPTTEDLNLIIISQQKNPGISYEYSVPTSASSSSSSQEGSEPQTPEPRASRPEPSRSEPTAVTPPQRGHVNIRPDAPASKTQVSGGVSLSTFLNGGNPAPVFPSTNGKQASGRPPKPAAQEPVEADQEESLVAPRPQRPVDPRPQRPVDPRPQRPVDPRPQWPVDPRPQQPVDPRPQRPVDPRPQQPADLRPQQPAEPRPQQPADPRPQQPVDPRPQHLDEARPQRPVGNQDQPPQGDEDEEEEGQARQSLPELHQQDQAGRNREPDQARPGQQQEKEPEADAQPGGQKGHHRGQQRGQQGEPQEGESQVGGNPSMDQDEVPQADSASQPYQGPPIPGYVTQARGQPDSVYQQTVSSRDQLGGGGVNGQGYPAQQGRNPMYPTQGDEVNPGRGPGYGQPYTIPRGKPNPYPGRYQPYGTNQDPSGYPNANPNPYPNANPNPNPYPNANPNPNPYPNPIPGVNRNPYPNRNLYPNQNPNLYPNQNPYPSGNQRGYPNPNPNTDPYRNPNGNPNPYPNPNPNTNPNNPTPNKPYPGYPYPQRPDTSGRQPGSPQQSQSPYLEIDPIESRRLGSEDSSTLGSSEFSALESGRVGVRDSIPPRYGWMDTGLSECSASCAGGIQQSIITCIEWRTFRPQDPAMCDGTRKPIARQQACNLDPCPPVWQVTEWMECSRTCGTGRQMRQVSCKQTLTAALTTMVPAERCDRRLEPDRLRECTLKPCTSWRAGEWGQCNVACGEGQRQREVDCVSDTQEELEESACADKQHSKPRDEETCDMGPCISNWFVSEWNDLCSAECGGGHKSRYVVCTTEGNSNALSDDECNSIAKPRTSRTCNSMPCGAIWLTSEWSQCSNECGEGTQTRMVLCTGPDEPHLIVNEEQCASKPKPTDRQTCKLKDCQAVWFNSDWSPCSRTCGGGQRKREVKCLDSKMMHSNNCDQSVRPPSTQSCNIQQCTTSIPDSGCRDKFRYCTKVAQARLCTYMFYKNNCCFSCFGHRR